MKLNIQLFASGTITFPRKTGDASWKWIEGKIEWSETSSSIETNQSQVKVALYCRVGTGGTTGKSWGGQVKVNNSTVINFTSVSSRTISDSWNKLAEATTTVTHNDDGTLTIPITGYVTGPSGTSIAGLKSSGSSNVTLDTIPRASDINSVTNITTDASPVVKWTPKSTTFKYKVKLSYGSYSRISALISPASTSEQSYNGIQITASDVASLITATSATFTATLYTYQADGTTLIDTAKTKNFTVTLNSNIIPSVSIGAPTEAGQTPAGWGVFVKTKSRIRYALTGSGIYGSSITAYNSTANGLTYSTQDVTTDFLKTAGTNTITARVTDSRGRQSNQASRTFNVVDYYNPTINSAQVQRCDVNGNIDDQGEYAYINFAGSVSGCAGHNKGTFKIGYKLKSASSYTFITIASNVETASYNDILKNGSTKIQLSSTQEYDIQFFIQDTFTSSSLNKELDTGFDLMNFNTSGKSMAIGKVSTRSANEEYLDIGLNVDIDESVKADKEVIVGSIESKNLFNDKYFSQGNEKNASPEIRVSSRQILYLKPGTYTFSTNAPSTIAIEVMVLNNTPGQNITYTYNYDSSWITNGLLTFTFSTAGYFCINLRYLSGANITVSEVLQYQYQLEKGNQATTYFPYQDLKNQNLIEKIFVPSLSINTGTSYDFNLNTIDDTEWRKNYLLLVTGNDSWVYTFGLITKSYSDRLVYHRILSESCNAEIVNNKTLRITNQSGYNMGFAITLLKLF